MGRGIRHHSRHAACPLLGFDFGTHRKSSARFRDGWGACARRRRSGLRGQAAARREGPREWHRSGHRPGLAWRIDGDHGRRCLARRDVLASIGSVVGRVRLDLGRIAPCARVKASVEVGAVVVGLVTVVEVRLAQVLTQIGRAHV